VLQDRWQFELEIILYIIPDPSAFKEAMEGPLLILGNRYCPRCRRRTPRSPRGIVLLVIDQGRGTSVISLGLRVVNLEAGGRRQQEGVRPSDVERCSHGRR
jgi:hypothetical protein